MILEDLIGYRFDTDKKETEIEEIEIELEKIFGCPVKAGYDCIWSHKHIDKEEAKLKKECGMDYIINYELYETIEHKYACDGGYDGEVHELMYLKGNGKYIVITGV